MHKNEKKGYDHLAHKAGCLRKRYRLTPSEAAACALWLQGTAERDIPELAQKMQDIRKRKWVSQC